MTSQWKTSWLLVVVLATICVDLTLASKPIIRGGFSNWSPWSRCSNTCGEGRTTRTRLCNSPPPQNGGESCRGPPIETKLCYQPCNSVGDSPKENKPARISSDGLQDDECGEWSSWSACSRSCGTGRKQRNRTCSSPPFKDEGANCISEVQACSERVCSVEENCGKWSAWSSCSKDCGPGSKTRTRTCTPTENEEEDCTQETKFCNKEKCSTVKDVNGRYGNWSDWSKCSKSCGGGLSFRNRSCDSPTPKGKGKDCSGLGSPRESSSCKEEPCAIELTPLATYPFTPEYRTSPVNKGIGKDDIMKVVKCVKDETSVTGGACEFYGEGNYVDIPNNPAGPLDKSSSITLLMDINIKAYGGYPFAFVSLSEFVILEVLRYGKVQFSYGSPRYNKVIDSQAMINLDKWNSIGMVYDRERKTVALWINGKEDEKYYLQYPLLITNQYPMVIGKTIEGKITCVQVFDKALDKDQIDKARKKCATFKP